MDSIIEKMSSFMTETMRIECIMCVRIMYLQYGYFDNGDP